MTATPTATAATFRQPQSRTRKRVGFLVSDNFEDLAVKVPYNALNQADVDVVMVSDRTNVECTGLRGQMTLQPDVTATEVRVDDFDAVVIPGGQSPTRLRRNQDAVRFVRKALMDGKVVAAMGTGTQMLIETEQLVGRQATGHPSIRKDVRNAGGIYIDQPIVAEGNLLTARRLGDMPIFTVMLCDYLHLSEDSPKTLSKPRNMWWKIAEDWGGTPREMIVSALNMALLGEQYTLNCFQLYAGRVNDEHIQQILEDMVRIKEGHIGLLESRLKVLGVEPGWQTVSGAALASIRTWLTSNSDLQILRQALSDIQTGIADARRLSSQLTDPVTANLLVVIAKNLVRCEERLGALYRACKHLELMEQQDWSLPTLR